MGLRSGLGDRRSTWQRLLAGDTAVHLRQPFIELPIIPVAMFGKAPVNLEQLRREILQELLVDAQVKLPLTDCGVVVGSSRSFQGIWEQLYHRYRQGQLDRLEAWEHYLPNHLAIATAQDIQTSAAVLSPMGACTTGMWAIAHGYEWLQHGACERVIVGAVESPVTALSIAGFQRIGALATTGCYPFDINREGLALGEGGALLMLETLEAADARQARIYGEILGWSMTCDAHHVSAPEATHQMAIAAIRQCLQRSGLSPDDVDHIHPHGTSTRLNDQAEAEMITQLFPHRPWVSGSKGATGHSLGASGILSFSLSLLMLRSQALFPCVGLNNPAFDLKFVTKAQAAPLHNSLCLSFGFGGQNGAVAIARSPKL